MVRDFSIQTTHQGLVDITREVERIVTEAARDNSLAADGCGLCTVLVRHTSASLVIQENADPAVRHDLEGWLNRLVPETGAAAAAFTHTDEGPDDMPSHIKAALTAVSLSIPVVNGRLALGRWQGIYLWEHRRSPHTREVVVHVGP